MKLLAWLLDLRGNDVACTPVFLGFLLLTKEDAVLCARAGAVGEEVKAALAADGVRLADYESIYGLVRALPRGTRVLLDGAPLELTETEFSILQCLAQNRGRVVPVRTIYETVWHETYMPASNNTVMVHIVNLRKKLEEDPANPRLIRTVWGKGYQID